jgi:hypothetical protein
MCNTEQRGITGSNDRCQSKAVALNQSPTPPSRSVETLRSPEWSSSLVGLDSLGKLRGADQRSPRHSIYHHALSYPAGYVSLSELRFMNGHTKSGGHWNAASRVMASASGGLGTPQSSSRSGHGSAKGSLLIIGDSPAAEWRSLTYRLATRREPETTPGGLRQPLTSPSIVRAYYCRSAVSVQDCTVVKYNSNCLPSELAKDAFLGRATSRDPCGLLQLHAVTTIQLSRQSDATYQKLPDRSKGCARGYIGLCLSKSERL